MTIKWGTAQLLGDRREQQDCFIVRSLGDSLLALVADGMGGHAEGARAAAIVAETFATAVAGNSANWPERLDRALDEGHAALKQAHGAGQLTDSAGTTLAAIILDSAGMWHVSVGDSVILALVDGRLERLNADHSMLPILELQVREGMLDPTELSTHPMRNQLRSAIMSDRPMVEIDCPSSPSTFAHGTTLLVMSDGLSPIDAPTMVKIIDEHGEPQAIAGELVAQLRAMAIPGQDNATVVVIRND